MYIDGFPAPANFTTDKAIEFVDEACGKTVFVLPAPCAVDGDGKYHGVRSFIIRFF